MDGSQQSGANDDSNDVETSMDFDYSELNQSLQSLSLDSASVVAQNAESSESDPQEEDSSSSGRGSEGSSNSQASQEDLLIFEVNEASNDWENAPQEIKDLRDMMLETGYQNDKIGDIGEIALEDFVTTFLLPTSARRALLVDALKSVYDGEDYWKVGDSAEVTLHKCIWACMHWGIEYKPELVAGDSLPIIQIDFWKKVVQGVVRMKTFPKENTKMMLDKGFSDEEHLEWSDVVDKCLDGAKNKTICVEVSKILGMETLLNNGMLGSAFMEELKRSVGDTLTSLGKPEDYFLVDDGEKTCELLISKGELICELATDYIDFLEANDYFLKNKTEFIVFRSEEVLCIMSNLLRIHREFMSMLVELQKPFDIEDDPDWIP